MLRIMCLFILLFASVAYADVSSGKKVYDRSCVNCHASGTAEFIKAPVTHDKKAWKKRFEKADKLVKQNKQFKTGMEYMVEQVKKGKGAMLAGGLCPKCSDQEYLDAINYMRDHK